MLLLFTGVALFMAWYSERVARQRRIVQSFRAQGAVISYQDKLPGNFAVIQPLWLRDLLDVDWFYRVDKVDLNGSNRATEVADKDLEQLSQLVGVRTLVLRDTTRVGPSGIQALGKMPSLESLYLHRPAIRGIDLQPLREASHLTKLTIYSPVGDEGLHELAQFPVLTELEVPVQGITREGVRELRSLGTLKRLELIGDFPSGTDTADLTADKLGLPPPDELRQLGCVWLFP
jgi:hypothetical protein